MKPRRLHRLTTRSIRSFGLVGGLLGHRRRIPGEPNSSAGPDSRRADYRQEPCRHLVGEQPARAP